MTHPRTAAEAIEMAAMAILKRRQLGPWNDKDLANAAAPYLATSLPAPEDIEQRADRLMQEFYLSPAYDPKAARPADNVKAAIAFALSQPSPAMVDTLQKLESYCRGLENMALRKRPEVIEQLFRKALGDGGAR